MVNNMNEGLQQMWEKLSLTEAEQTKVIVDKEWLEESKAAGENC